MSYLSVPKVIDFRDTAVLSCVFELESSKLYSVKWYKDDLEFYRFMPNNVPQAQAFLVDGVKLKVSFSEISVHAASCATLTLALSTAGKVQHDIGDTASSALHHFRFVWL